VNFKTLECHVPQVGTACAINFRCPESLSGGCEILKVPTRKNTNVSDYASGVRRAIAQDCHSRCRGLSWAKIAAKLGVGAGTVYRMARASAKNHVLATPASRCEQAAGAATRTQQGDLLQSERGTDCRIVPFTRQSSKGNTFWRTSTTLAETKRSSSFCPGIFPSYVAREPWCRVSEVRRRARLFVERVLSLH